MRHERSLVAVAFVLAAVLRVCAWSEPPLGPEEAAHAWRAARAATQGEVIADGVTNPFLTSAQAALFAFAGPNVFLARLPSALCGLALVLVPLLLRQTLGVPRAAALAALAALDPTLVLGARASAGSSAAIVTAALAAVGLVRWADAARIDAARARRWAVVASVAGGALLTAGPDAWSLAPLVCLVAFSWRPWAACPAPGGPCAAAFAIGIMLPATAGLWAVPWASGVSASLTVWHQSSARTFALVPMLPLVLLALAGLACSWRARPRVGAHVLAVAWSVWLAMRGSGATALAVVLIVIASGIALAWSDRAARPREWQAALAVAGAALIAQASLAARPIVVPAPVPALRGLETLASDLERIAVERGREASELPVVVVGDRPDPEVGWALRDLRRLRFAAARPKGDDRTRPALVARSRTPPDAPPAGHVGASYGSPRGTVNLWVPVEH